MAAAAAMTGGAWAAAAAPSKTVGKTAMRRRAVVSKARVGGEETTRSSSRAMFDPLGYGAPREDAAASAAPSSAAAAGAAAAAALMVSAEPALAAGREEWGILAGRSVALLHPIGMAATLGMTLYAGYLGLQWRSVRTVGDEIKALKAKLPKGEDAVAPAALVKEIEEKTAKRADLVKGNYRDRHFNVGSILLAGGVFLGIEGAFNTYTRVGKLFPGPHLFAGASIVILWAAAAALVPAMQKGNDSARSAHIALNAVNTGLFLWQVPTGWEIVLKVFQFTEWP